MFILHYRAVFFSLFQQSIGKNTYKQLRPAFSLVNAHVAISIIQKVRFGGGTSPPNPAQPSCHLSIGAPKKASLKKSEKTTHLPNAPKLRMLGAARGAPLAPQNDVLPIGNKRNSARARGAPSADKPRSTTPVLRPHTPPVKYLPGGSPPPPSNKELYFLVLFGNLLRTHKKSNSL